jgi:putative ABC transport system substrate-binding protein
LGIAPGMKAIVKRREFITLFSGAAVTWPLATRAQHVELMRRIGVLQPQRESDREAQSWIRAFRQRLKTLGWVEGYNVQIDLRWYAGDLARLRSHAADLVRLKPDLIFCMSTPTVAALQRATQTIPIVFVNANNPVGFGFVASLARPGGNITGFVAFEPAMGGKWLEMLREIAPSVERVGLVYNPKTHTGQYFQSIETAARLLSVKLVQIAFDNGITLERRIDDFAREPSGGLVVMPDASTRVNRDLIVRLAARHRLPAVYTYRLFIATGGLAYYGTNTTEQFRKAANYVHRILSGEKPANLPVQAPTKFELVINLKAAKRIGLDLPPRLLARADEVIE